MAEDGDNLAEDDEVDGEVVDGAEVAEVEQEPVDQPQTIFRDYLRSQGFNDIPDEEDDNSLLEAMTSQYQRVMKAPPEEEIRAYQERVPLLHEYESRKADFEKYLESQRSAPQAPSQPQPKSDMPQWDPMWLHVTELDPSTGMYKPKGAYGSAEAAMQRNKYERVAAERARRITEAPVDTLMELGLADHFKQMREEVKRETIEELRKERASEEAKQRFGSFWRENQASLYQLDPITNQPLIDIHGQPRLSEHGIAYYKAREQANYFGITDEAKVHEFAERSLQLTKPQTPVEKKAEKQKSFLERGKSRSRGNSIRNAAEKGEAQTEGLSFLSLIEQVEKEHLVSQ